MTPAREDRPGYFTALLELLDEKFGTGGQNADSLQIADVFLVGVTSWILVLIAGSAAVMSGEDFEEPILMIFAPALYAVFANVAYTAGPILRHQRSPE